VIPARIEIDATEVKRRLRALIQANADLTPLMRNISEFLRDRVEENFAQQGRPRWEPLRPSTIKKRGNAGPILQVTGQLAASVTPFYDATTAGVGTNKEYARVQQDGAKKGAFGQYSQLLSSASSKGGRSQKDTFKRSPVVNIPWGDIPARPFLLLTEQDKGEDGLIGLVINYERSAAGN
jgi:phage virion morphogenesis protein